MPEENKAEITPLTDGSLYVQDGVGRDRASKWYFILNLEIWTAHVAMFYKSASRIVFEESAVIVVLGNIRQIGWL